MLLFEVALLQGSIAAGPGHASPVAFIGVAHRCRCHRNKLFHTAAVFCWSFLFIYFSLLRRLVLEGVWEEFTNIRGGRAE